MLVFVKEKADEVGNAIASCGRWRIDVPSPVPPFEVPAPRRALEATTAGVAGGILKACALK